jgi:hypothetical protein
MIKNLDKQPLRKTDFVVVGDVVWIWIPAVTESHRGFHGPLFVIDIRAQHISTATIYVLFDSFNKEEISVRLHDIYVPIIDTIEDPRRYNAK